MTAEAKGQAHLKRWVTGLTALPVLIACVLAGGWALAGLAAAAAVACLWEYFRMGAPARSAAADPIQGAGFACALGLVLLAQAGRSDLMPLLLAADVVICGALALREFAQDRSVLERTARQLLGVAYIPLLLSLVVMLRATAGGAAWIFLLCAVVFAGDTVALYAGTLWGRHKLCPAISPGKTVEGALGGLAANLIAGAAGKALFFPDVDWSTAIVFALGVGLAGQAGDLFESALKRAAGIKDSSRLLPGHGGVLDRIDALLFALPVAYVVRTMLG
ncbi:MAG TPA: phosphatidate cytidylyltransferase [Steroidobacteraceae bacterium]|nr:phosphatidate cytidylyltransferase [Steroidobacteraceae bacterium]